MKILFLALLCLKLIACQTAIYQPPAPDLAPEQLAQLLLDVHLAEALLSEMSNSPSKDSLAQALYLQILHTHQLDSLSFNQTMSKLLQHPEYSKNTAEQALQLLQSKLSPNSNPQ